jgi:hypothetical protein
MFIRSEIAQKNIDTTLRYEPLGIALELFFV